MHEMVKRSTLGTRWMGTKLAWSQRQILTMTNLASTLIDSFPPTKRKLLGKKTGQLHCGEEVQESTG